jgi:3-deoxy-D-manno-octulosonate 8-phosphate phosphatase (KDO 8-P phosphatase)
VPRVPRARRAVKDIRLMNLEERCQQIELVLSDVDGVLTDGHVVYNNQGIETKRFHIRDGLGIKLWQKAGGHFGIVTQRSSQVVKIRAAELNVTIVRQGTQDKLATLHDILKGLSLTPAQTCYIGDDLPDVPVVRCVGLGVAVSDACEELRRCAHHVTQTRGGEGAVRETLEMILKAQRRWDDVIHPYLT